MGTGRHRHARCDLGADPEDLQAEMIDDGAGSLAGDEEAVRATLDQGCGEVGGARAGVGNAAQRETHRAVAPRPAR